MPYNLYYTCTSTPSCFIFHVHERKKKQPRENKSKPAYNAMGNKSKVAAILRNANARETVFFFLTMCNILHRSVLVSWDLNVGCFDCSDVGFGSIVWQLLFLLRP